MRLFLIFVVFLVTLLRLPGGSSFVVSARTHHAAPTLLLQAKRENTQKSTASKVDNNEKKNVWQDAWERIQQDPVTEVLKILITGSPDGVMMIGKPQHNWSTGKPYDRKPTKEKKKSLLKSQNNKKK